MTVMSTKWAEAWRLHRRAWRLLSRYMPRFFTAIVLHSLTEALTPYVLLVLTARWLDVLLTAQDTRATVVWGAAMLISQAVLMTASGLLRRWKEAKWESLYRVSDRIMTDHVLALDYATLDDARTRALLDRVRENTEALGRGLVMAPEICQLFCLGTGGTLGAAAVWALWGFGGACADWRWPTALSAAWAISLTASFWLARAAGRRYNRSADRVVAIDRAYYTVMEAMFDSSNAADRHLYCQSDAYARRLEEADRAFFGKQGIKRRGRGAVLSALSSGVSVLWIGAAAFVAIAVMNENLSIAAAILPIGALAVLTKFAADWYHACDSMRVNAPYLQTVFETLDLPPRLYRGSLTTEKRTDGDYEWELRHVTFRYPGQQQAALSDVSVTITRGSCTAIVGENGSGKSTFVKLLCRLYDPDEGEILLNGIDIRKYNYEEYIALIAAVFQDFCLLPQSIADNVAARTTHDAARVRRSLADVGFDTDGLENGPDTPLYQSAFAHGVIPTLGDAQKIAIARALYKQAPCVILDEPTAVLDPIAEADIYKRFDRIAQDRTAIYNSHRLSSCRFCRDILVFDHGRLVERGSHSDLVSKPAGRYRALWEAQAQYYYS